MFIKPERGYEDGCVMGVCQERAVGGHPVNRLLKKERRPFFFLYRTSAWPEAHPPPHHSLLSVPPRFALVKKRARSRRCISVSLQVRALLGLGPLLQVGAIHDLVAKLDSELALWLNQS